MTIVKQGGVSTRGHQDNLRKYINDDRKVLLRDSQNMEECRDLRRWAAHMERTRRAFGHDKASRRTRDPKTGELVAGRNTALYHQVLAFLPDECDVNGGRLSPEDCMAYAREYAAAYYPNQQVVMALHDEWCREDRTHRYAVHLVINRTDLSTGRRLDEGLGRSAKQMRAERVRKMDAAWGLKQVEEGVRNSAVHKRQPSKVEREIEGRGGRSYKTNLRELCQLAAERSQDVFAYRELLESWGVDTQFRNGRMYATDRDNARYSFSIRKLDADIRMAEPPASRGDAREGAAGPRDAYLDSMRRAYLEYRKAAHAMEGTELDAFPKLRLPRPPEGLADDPEVRRTILAYWRGADELRVKMASNVPYARRGPAGTAGPGGQQMGRDGAAQGRDRGAELGKGQR